MQIHEKTQPARLQCSWGTEAAQPRAHSFHWPAESHLKQFQPLQKSSRQDSHSSYFEGSTSSSLCFFTWSMSQCISLSTQNSCSLLSTLRLHLWKKIAITANSSKAPSWSLLPRKNSGRGVETMKKIRTFIHKYCLLGAHYASHPKNEASRQNAAFF